MAVGLCGCTPVYYVNPNVTQANAQAQFDADSAQCLAYARQAVPSVQYAPIQPPPPSSYTTYGQLNADGSYSGTTYANQSATSPMQAFQQGQQIGDSINADRDRNRIYAGCLAQHGWTARSK